MRGYGDNYRAYKNTSNAMDVRTGDGSKPIHVAEKRAGLGLRTGYLVAKIEHSVYSALGDSRDRWHKPRNPTDDRTHKVHDFMAKVQNEASKMIKQQFAPLSPSRWAVHETHDGNNLSGELGMDSTDLQKKEPPPAMISTGGWVRPNRAMWASSPDEDITTKPAGSLSQPTNDVGVRGEFEGGSKTSDGRKAEKKYKGVLW